MRVVLMGTPDFAVPALEALVKAGHEIAAVYSQPARPAGRGQAPRLQAVHAAAAARGLPVLTPATLRDAEAQAIFDDHQAEVAVVVAYGLILPQAILDMPEHGCLNIHASLLPRWRGAAPIHRALLAGDLETGVCIMRMEAGLDTGPVLERRIVEIGPEETAGDLHDRLARIGAEEIAGVLADLPNLVAEPQADDGVTYADKIDKAEARIDWTRPCEEVDRQIRGLSPAPGAWTSLAGRRLKVLRCRLAGAGEVGAEGRAGRTGQATKTGADTGTGRGLGTASLAGTGRATNGGTALDWDGGLDADAPGGTGGTGRATSAGAPGEVLEGLTVACGTGAVTLREVQLEGRGRQEAEAFLRGMPVAPGTVLGDDA